MVIAIAQRSAAKVLASSTDLETSLATELAVSALIRRAQTKVATHSISALLASALDAAGFDAQAASSQPPNAKFVRWMASK